MASDPAAPSPRSLPAWLDRLRPTARMFRVLATITIVATVVVMVSGSLVRLTGSGLGCSDWPTCEHDQFTPALDQPHAVMEFVNRMLSGVLGVPILLVLGAAIIRRPFRRDLLGWAIFLFTAMMGEAVLGAFVVKFGLTPPIVIAHFMLAVVMLWNALVLHDRALVPDALAAVPRRRRVSERAQALGWLTAAATTATILFGTIVTGAGPHGGDIRADRLPFSIVAAVRVHSVAAWVSVALAVATLLAVYRHGAEPAVRKRARWVTGALLGQEALGYAQYFTGVPPLLVGLHVFGSTLVWITVVRLVLAFTARDAAAEPGATVGGGGATGEHRPADDLAAASI